MPSFVDSHCHLTAGVSEIYEPVLHGIQNLEGYLKVIAEFAGANPGLEGVQATGWVNAIFDAGGPTREELDNIVPNIPVVLFSEDCHNAWVNSKALEITGITAQTPDPANGKIERDPSGRPSGTLREAAAELVKKAVPAYSVNQVREGLGFFQKKAHALGITTVYNPLVSWKDTIDLQALQEWESSGEMNLRCPSAVEFEAGDALETLDELIQLREKSKAGKFHVLAAKIFMDGVLEGGTAYLEHTYLHTPDTKGLLVWDPEKFNLVCMALDKAGFQIHVHSIGDAATRITLDGFAAARKANGVRDARHSITHLQLVNDVDLDRFAELGVIAVPQPYWFLVDGNYEQALKYIGAERAARQYPMMSFFERGVVVASASDYNVTLHPNPLVAIEMGVTRTVPADSVAYINSKPGQALVPEECVPVEQMIASFTIHGAYAAFMEREIGSLEVGKKADFIILDKNILRVRPAEIHQARVMMTVFDGRMVYQHSSFLG